jgi:signal transduction histidine kinase/CheY-like chemotaxis protein
MSFSALPMLAPPQSSLRQKALFLVLGTTTAALLLGAIVFLVFENFASRKADAQGLTSLAEIISFNVAAPVTFEDKHSAEAILRPLKNHGHITRAAAYMASLDLLATYPADEPLELNRTISMEDRIWFEDGRIRLTKRLYTPEGRVVGLLYLEMDQAERMNRLLTAAMFLLIVIILVGVLAWEFGRRWVHVITGPVLDLAEVASRVSTTRDFSLRAQIPRSKDELGTLVNSFNGMLERIQEQDRRLEDHRGQLESQVAMRTSELMSANNELLIAKERADVSNRAKSSFLANMSHELRTPLNAILLYSELIREEAEEVGQKGILSDARRIETSGRHLLSLINDILDLSKIEAGKMTVNKDTIEVVPLIHEVLNTVGPLALQNANTIAFEADPEVSSIVSDATKLRQSLFNLLSNACKFTKNGQIKIKAFLANPPELEEAWLHISVEDTGIGISPEQQLRIFNEFIQAEENTTRQFGGTGLGLALSRKFCQILGGDIRLHSELGHGAMFTIVLPLAPPEEVTDPAPAMKVEDPCPVPLPIHGPILLIDDDAFLLNALSRLLILDGHEVMTASDGEEGLRVAAESHPGLIVLDVMMPHMDGWSVLKALKADPALAHIPVVMLTILDEAEKGLALGAADYLFKPIDRAQLTNALRRFRPSDTPARVLVVEDDLPTQQAVQRSLLSAGWESWPAMDGFAAIEHLRKEIPSLILLDLMMPGMDGFTFLAEKQQNPDWAGIPVIVLTARDLSEQEREQLRQAQVEAVLQKGLYSKGELMDEVRRAVQRGLGEGYKGDRQ